ncbi:MAG: phosphotransferase [Woeseiaceae bacterium]
MDELAYAAVAAIPPSIDLDEIERAVRVQYGLVGQYAPLVSERDQNLHLRASTGDEYVAKISSAAESGIVSDFQVAALLHVESLVEPGVPRVVRTRDGKTAAHVTSDGIRYKLRLVTYLPGPQLSTTRLNRRLALDFGRQLARLDVELQSFSHPGDQPKLLWDLQKAGQLRGLVSHIDDSTARDGVEQALDDFDRVFASGLGEFRTQVIHGDANPGNVIVHSSGTSVSGFIDFGDMVRAPRVCEPAIAAAYLRGEEADPLEWIAAFIAGYSRVAPLLECEQALLFDLVRARLAATITLLFWRLGARSPDDPYREQTLREEADAIRFLAVLDRLGRASFLEQIVAAIPQ